MPSGISGFLSKRGAGRANVRQDISNYKGMIMPVTKCEPETTRKASRKYAKRRNSPVCPAGADGGSERAAGLTD